MEYRDMRMLTSVANCARTPPMLLPVDPRPWRVSRSITSTFLHARFSQMKRDAGSDDSRTYDDDFR